MRILKRKFPRSSPESRDSFHDFPLLDADACVKCGLCLPHCPTYALHQHEGDSPRGRIALMQGLAQGELDPRGSAVQHLDGCLVCRACEPVCPAEVPYGRLIDAGRTGLWRAGRRPSALWRLLAAFRRTPRRIAVLERLLLFAHRSGVIGLFRHPPVPRLRRLAAHVTRTHAAPKPGRHPAKGERRGEVMLFLGCVARPLDGRVLHACVNVLTAMGYDVNIPAAQGCCGAMDAHAGDRETAQRLVTANVAAFGGDSEILSAASGCAIVMRESGDASGARVHDVMDFISRHADALPALRPLHGRVLVHQPCTQRNALREGRPTELLRRIPDLEIAELAWRDCCGAAGSYLFEHPGEADALGTRLLASITAAPDYLVTSNTGCSIHLARLLREQGMAVKVRHPVELLAESLGV